MADPINQQNPSNQGPFDTTQGQGGLSNPDPYGTQDLAGNRTPLKNDTLYSLKPAQRLDTNQNDQDLTDDPDAANIDETDDQYDIAGGQGLYGAGNYGNQGGAGKPGSNQDRYGTKTSQDQNGYQQ